MKSSGSPSLPATSLEILFFQFSLLQFLFRSPACLAWMTALTDPPATVSTLWAIAIMITVEHQCDYQVALWLLSTGDKSMGMSVR